MKSNFFYKRLGQNTISSYRQKSLFLFNFQIIIPTIIISVILHYSALYAQEVIDPRSGKLFLTVTDIEVQAGPVYLKVERSLQTTEEQSGILGSRWRLNWESRLIRLGSIALIRESTGPVYFKNEDGDARFTGPSGAFLVVEKDGRAVWTRPDGHRVIYDADGRLVETNDTNGNRIGLHYSQKGRIQRVEGPGGGWFDFTLDDKGRLILITASTGAKVEYAYKRDNIAEVMKNGSLPVKYSYNEKGSLVHIEHPRTGTIDLAYDVKGRVTSRRWADDGEEFYEYDDDANTMRHINSAGAITLLRRNENGKQEVTTDPSGNTTTVEYDENGRPVTVTGPAGKTSTFVYDARGRIIKAVGCCGGEAHFEYVGGTFHYRAITDSDDTRQEFEYDGAGNLLAIREDGKVIQEFSYYPGGLLKSMIGLGSPPRHFAYYPNGLLRSESNALGETTTYAYDKSGNLIRETDSLGGETIWEYDEQNRLVTATDPSGGQASYDYDTAGHMVQVTDAMGEVVNYAYDSLGRMISITDKEGGISRYQYNASGNLISETDPGGNTRRYQYDVAGNLLKEINPLGGVTTYTYNSSGNVLTETDPSGSIWKYSYSDAGVLAIAIDPLGGVTEFSYNTRGQLETVTDPERRVTRYGYDPNGNMIRIDYPEGLVIQYAYDEEGRLIRELDNRGVDTRYEYDRLGQLIRERRASGLEISHRYDANGNLLEWWDSLGGGMNFQFNSQGLIASTINAARGSTLYSYDISDNLVQVSNPLGHTEQMAYNTKGDLTLRTDPSGDTTIFTYDPTGELLKIQQPGGGVIRFTYDPVGNRICTTNPLGATARSSYDAKGRLTSITDAKGQTINYTYDLNDRLTKKILPEGKVVNYKYNTAGNLVEIDDGAFPIRYNYNTRGLLAQIEYPVIKRILKYDYNDAGLLSKFTDSEGNEIHYAYDDIKLLRNIKFYENKTVTFSYDEKNRLAAMTYPNGVKGTWQYDVMDRPARIVYQDNSGEPISDQRYSYDADSNLIEVTDAKGEDIQYQYDGKGQLLEEKSVSGAIRYSYLPGGNRETYKDQSSTVIYRYNQADQLLEADQEAFKYDENGNLIEKRSSRGITRFDYDSFNRLIRISMPNKAEISYGYAPTGERIWRKDASGHTWFVTDGTNLLAELDENLNSKAAYLQGPGIDRPLMMSKDGRSYFYHSDFLGSIFALTDTDGKISASYRTNAFGNIIEQMDTIRNPFVFTGREYESETGLYYYRARYYDPKQGRFLSEDPLRIFSGLNPYVYVWNNPTRYRDPAGLYGEDVITPDVIKRVVKPYAECLKMRSNPQYPRPDSHFFDWARNMVRNSLINTPVKKGDAVNILERQVKRSLLKEKIIQRLSTAGKDKVIVKGYLSNIKLDKQLEQLPKYQPPTPTPPGGQQNIGGQAGGQPARQTVIEGSGRGSRQTRMGQTRVSEGSPGRAPRQTRISPRPGVGRPSTGSGREGWLKRFVSGPTGKVMEIVKNHPGKIVLAISAYQYAACKSRGMSTEDCMKQAISSAIVSAGIGKGLSAAVGKVIVVLGPEWGALAGTTLVVAGGIVGGISILYAGHVAKGALTAEADRQKLLAAEAKRIEELLKKNGMLDQTVASTRKLINKELKSPHDSYEKACQAAQKHVQAAKLAYQEAQKHKQALAALVAKITAKAPGFLWEDAHTKKKEIDAIYTKVVKSQIRVAKGLEYAGQLSQDCKSVQDGYKIKELYATAKGLSELLRNKIAEAANLNQKLKGLKSKVCAVNTDLAKARGAKVKIENIHASFEKLRAKAQPDLNNAYELQVILSKQCEAWHGRVDSLVKNLTYGLIDHGDLNIVERVESKLGVLRADINKFGNPKCKTPSLTDINNYAALTNTANQGAAGIIQNIGEVDLTLCNAMPTADGVVANIETSAALAWAAVVQGEGLPQKAAQCGEDENPFENDPMGKKSRDLQALKKNKRGLLKAINEENDKRSLSSKGKFTLNKLGNGIEENLEKMRKPSGCNSHEQCEVEHDKGWTCNTVTKKCIPPEEKKPTPECDNAKCEEKHGKGWKCNENGDCVGLEEKEKTKKQKCDNAECKKKGHGWKCNKDGKCVGPDDKKEKIAKTPEKPKIQKPEPKKPKPKPKPKPKKPVKYCPRHTYCDKVGIGRGRALDLNRDGICETCGGKITGDQYIITWPDPSRWHCPEHD